MTLAEEAVRGAEIESPYAVLLAEVVSLAAVVDPPLLRAARLTLLPSDADAGVEADLWLGPLVKSRGADGLVFLPDIVDLLRQRLARRTVSPMVDQAWELTRAMHAHLSPAVQMEEEIAYLSVSRDPLATVKIEELLRAALAAMVSGGRVGLANWAARALPSLPADARESTTARMLAAGASLRLGGDARVPGGYMDAELPEWLSWVAPSDLRRVDVRVRVYPEAITLEAAADSPASPTTMGGAIVRLPETQPLLAELSWDEHERRGVEAGSIQVTLRRGETRTVAVPPHIEIHLRNVLGDVYSVRTATRHATALKRDMIDTYDEWQRHNPFFGRARTIDRIERFVRRDTPEVAGIAVVIGESGSGKTALLARLAHRFREAGAIVADHYFEFGDPLRGSASLAERSVYAQLAARFPEALDSVEGRPSGLRELLETIGSLHTSQSAPVVVIFDAVDEARELLIGWYKWLQNLVPGPLPPGMTMLVSGSREPPGESDKPNSRQDIPLWYLLLAADETEEALREFWVYHVKRLGIEGGVSEASVLRLATASGGSFAVADVLREWLELQPLVGIWSRLGPPGDMVLDALWADLAKAMTGGEATLIAALGTLAVARGPLSADDMRGALGAEVSSDQFSAFARVAAPFIRAPVPGRADGYSVRNEIIRTFVMHKHLSGDRAREAHRRLAEATAGWLPDRGPPVTLSDYGLRFGVEHWLIADAPRAVELSTSAAYLKMKCKRLGLEAVQAELDEIAAAVRSGRPPVMDAVLSAVTAEARRLQQTPDALPTLLFTRMRSAGWTPEQIERLLRLEGGPPPLRMRHPLLPNTLEHRGAARHTGAVTGCVTHERSGQVISWSEDGTLRLWDAETLAPIAVLSGHTAPVTGCAIGNDLLISSSRDGTVIGWDLRQFTIQYKRTAHEGGGLGVAVLDVNTALSWGVDGTLALWDMNVGKRRMRLVGHGSPVVAATSSPDGRYIFSGSEHGTVRVWDASSGAILRTYKGHSGAITAMLITGDGRYAITSSEDRTLRVWPVIGGPAGTLLLTDEEMLGAHRVFTGHTRGVIGFNLAPASDRITSWSYDGTIRRWDLAMLERSSEPVAPTLTLEAQGGAILDCALLVDDFISLAQPEEPMDAEVRRLSIERTTFLVAASANRTLRISDEFGAAVGELVGHEAAVACCAHVRSARSAYQRQARVVSGSKDGVLILWNVRIGGSAFAGWQLHEGSRVASTAVPPEAVSRCVALSDARRIVSLTNTQEGLEVRDIVDDTRVLAPFGTRQQSERIPMEGFAISDNDELAVAWSREFTLWVIGLPVHGVIGTIGPGPDRVNAGVFLPSVAGSAATYRVLMAFADGTLTFVDPLELRQLATVTGHKGPVSNIAVLPNDRRAVSASWDGTLRVWEIDQYALLDTLEGHTDRVVSCAAGNRVVISASADKTLRVWFFDNPEMKTLILLDHEAPLLGCAAVRGGWEDPIRFVSWDANRVIRAWRVRGASASSVVMAGHKGRVNDVAVDYERGIVYSCSDDETVRAWNLETGRELGVVYGVAPFRSLAVVQGGVCAGDEAGETWVLDFATHAPLDTSEDFDAFVSYNAADKQFAVAIADQLQQHGLRVWFDREQLGPIESWLEAITSVLRRSRSFVILVGEAGIGTFQEREVDVIVRDQKSTTAERPVILVLMPGAPELRALPEALSQRFWLDMRQGVAGEAMERLVNAIRGGLSQAAG